MGGSRSGWLYGDAGDRIPVAGGELWAVGDHRVLCGDLEEGAATLALAVAGQPPTLAYTDPPWNAGNARAFRTKAAVDGPQGRPVDFVALLDRVLQAARSSGELWCEMGAGTVDVLRQRAQAAGAEVLGGWPITYYRRQPCRLLRISWPPHPPPLSASPAGLDDAHTPAWVIHRRTKPGQLVLDPCCGRGLTGVAAARLGRRFLGIELAPRRAAVTLDRLARTTGQAPRRLELKTSAAG